MKLMFDLCYHNNKMTERNIELSATKHIFMNAYSWKEIYSTDS